jgi:Clp amino terminal domain, pathogenicity island component
MVAEANRILMQSSQEKAPGEDAWIEVPPVRSDVDHEALACLREATWLAGYPTPINSTASGAGEGTAWSVPAQLAVRGGLIEARKRGLSSAGVVHLLLALLEDRESIASRQLKRAGIEVDKLYRSLDSAGVSGRNSRPWTPTADALEVLGFTREGRLLPRFSSFLLRKHAERQSDIGLVLHVIREEALRQCVRLGHSAVAPVHLMIALISAFWQMESRQVKLRPELAPHSYTLPFWITTNSVYGNLTRSAIDLSDGTEVSQYGPVTKRPPRPWTRQAVDAINDAIQIGGPSKRAVGTDHLFAALMVGEYANVQVLLSRLGVDILVERSKIERFLT